MRRLANVSYAHVKPLNIPLVYYKLPQIAASVWNEGTDTRGSKQIKEEPVRNSRGHSTRRSEVFRHLSRRDRDRR